MLINVKMPTIVGILTFMSMINFMLCWVEHEKSFITSGLVLFLQKLLLRQKVHSPIRLHYYIICDMRSGTTVCQTTLFLTSKLRKGKQTFLCTTHCFDWNHIPINLHEDILNIYWVMECTRIYMQNSNKKDQRDIPLKLSNRKQSVLFMSSDMRFPTMCMCNQQRLRSAWA